MEVSGRVMEGRSHQKVHGEHQRMSNGRYSVQVVTVFPPSEVRAQDSYR